MTLAWMARGIAALVAAVLVVVMIEITSMASERHAARAIHHVLSSDALEPELPGVSELEPAEPGEAPALTR